MCVEQEEKLSLTCGSQSGSLRALDDDGNDRSREIPGLISREHRNDLRGIRKILFKGERSVGLERERFAAHLKVGVRARSAVNDEAGLDPQEEILAVVHGIRAGAGEKGTAGKRSARKGTGRESRRRTRETFEPGDDGRTGKSGGTEPADARGAEARLEERIVAIDLAADLFEIERLHRRRGNDR